MATFSRQTVNGVPYEVMDKTARQETSDIKTTVVHERSIAPVSNSGRTAVCVPLGPVAERTIITKGTGVPRSGGVNNFATADYIPVPKTIVSVVSKYCTFYVSTYDKDKNHVSDYNTEDNVHAFGTITIDNSAGNISYIKIGFYTANGYSAERYNNAEVIYYTETDQRSGNFIDSQELGAYSLTTSEDVTHIVYSDIRIGPKAYKKAERNIFIKRDGNADHNWRYLLALNKSINASGEGVDLVESNDWNHSTQAAYGTMIPKGACYWLGYSYGNSQITNVATAIEEAPKHIHVRELEDGEPGYFGFGSGFDVYFTDCKRVGVADKLYADTDLFIVADDGYRFTLKLYKDGSWFTQAWTANYSAQIAYIPKGAWYRYNVGRADNSVVAEDEIRAVYNRVKVQKNADVNANIIYQMFGIQNDLSAIRRRVSELENNTVPSYYETHMAQKAQLINQRKAALTEGDQFAFITDIHINGYTSTGGNTKHAKSLINYLMRNTTVRKLFNGGDLFNSGTGMTAAETLDIIQQSVVYTQPDDCNGVQYLVFGNHDLGDDYPGGVHYGPSITAEQFYRANGNDAKRNKIICDVNTDGSFYFDENGIRYIVSTLGVDSYTGESIGNAYLFLTKAIHSANSPVVIIQHVLWNSNDEEPSFRPYRLSVLQDIVDACNSRGISRYGDGAEYIVDYSDSTSRVCCIIGGHIHKDRYSYTTGGVPIIVTTTDCWGAELDVASSGRANAAGTVNEQAFDIFTLDLTENKLYATRIGYGEDRTFTIPTVED